MYGDVGNKLVQSAKRTQNLARLAPYATELVRAATREVRDLEREVARLLAPFSSAASASSGSAAGAGSAADAASLDRLAAGHEQATACALLVSHLAMRRDKRCLLAYHRARAARLEALVWSGRDAYEIAATAGRAGAGEQQAAAAAADTGGGGAEGAGAGGGSSLSPEEEEYVRQYADLLAAYKGQWTDVDLTGSLEPPRDLFIDVRVLRDAGEIQTEYGAITLTKNSQFYVRQGDVERLIAQGYLQKLS